MRLPLRTTSTVFGLAAGAALLLGPGAAAGATAAAAPGGWQRYHAAPFTTAAGALCPFELHSDVLFDQEYVRTTASFPDGSPKRQEYVGPLVVRVTNTATGHSVVRDLSGRAVLTYRADGSYDFAAEGPVSFGFHPGDRGYPPGYYVVNGEHVVRFAADGTRTLLVDHGPEENLCTTLG